MTRLTKREIREIRRVQRAVSNEAREEFDQVRLAGGAGARRMASAAGIPALVARYSGLAEAYWLVRHRIIAPAARVLEKRRAIAQLRGLSDHMLRDIGVDRTQIGALVEDLQSRPVAAPRPVPGLFAAIARLRRERRAVRALSALDDRLLSDIGVLRPDIPAVVKGLKSARPRPVAEGTPARAPRRVALYALRQWNLSRQAANDMARLDPEALADLGYVKGDVDWVPEVLAERKLSA